ncbi:MAG TPA: hypothetical protein VM869_33780 [Enhygromyxa sp.]|nr:hypothetical protein [Enhygromyxa sp.]
MRTGFVATLGLAISGCIQTSAEDGDTGSGSDTTVESESESETGIESSSWEPVLQADMEIGALMSVWGPSPDELFVVGGQPEAGGGRILRGGDDRADRVDPWELESLPAEVAMLNWVYGVDGEVWSVGVGGAIVRREAEGWVAEESPTDRVLWGLWGASAAELWAVGGDGVSDDPVLLRRDEAGEWTSVELPPLGTESHALFKIWGRAADDVWSVGDAGAIVHWDGSSWTAHSDPDGIDLISVWGSPDEGVIAVGGRANGRIDRLSDDAWSGQTLAIPGLNGVWVDPVEGATAVGVQGTIYRVAAGGYELEQEDANTSMVLHAVFGFSGGPRYAVGGSLLMSPPFVGVILRAD